MVFQLLRKPFAKAGVEYRSLTDYPTLIELAIEKGMVSREQEGILLKWSGRPCKLAGEISTFD